MNLVCSLCDFYRAIHMYFLIGKECYIDKNKCDRGVKSIEAKSKAVCKALLFAL